ncbi:Phosphotransferase enzyme family protein [Streptomyces sp. 3213]|uniref:aminoglycoside phosphotransferase family protein n=1 Tax=Streptomyces sp. 3213.3 TaxID=1855348 RepID=UPI000897F653|nr:aminoglycoside phosphotransferase family protein [Streptomyces sp. 3213.3]SEC48217.1 Phosphotransferase enzyme family protein [Streptomyces sp. 3213] [Streptomyces sp. 3213.3]
MREQDGEVPLHGGRVTPGVVRVGDTVRRPVTEASPFVARLLGHLERRGFAGAPRHLGVDAAGRDTFSYLPGQVPARFRRWTDVQVAAAGVLLRSLHDATRGFAPAGASPVVCHHDPGPNNAVFRDGLPYAFIDFDTAAPGDPLEDVGYAAWTWCVSSRATAPPAWAQAAQVRILADAYGLEACARGELVDAMLDRQTHNASWWLRRLELHSYDAELITSRVEWSEREHAYTTAHRSAFERALQVRCPLSR